MSDVENILWALSTPPKYGTDAYGRWIDQEDFLDFLSANGRSNELILYASVGTTFIYGVLVPSKYLRPVNENDLLGWSCNPFSSWGISYSFGRRPKIQIESPLTSCASKTIAKGEQLVFVRSFDGRQDNPQYIELLQKFVFASGLDFVPERNSYCRFDKHGEIEDVVRIIDMTTSDEREGRIVIVLRDVLDQYMALTGSSWVRLFDSTRFEGGHFGGWQNNNEQVARMSEQQIYYRMGRNGKFASYVRGFQILKSSVTKGSLIKRFHNRDDEREYAEFIAWDWKNKKTCECSCDPKKLGNYFTKSDLPFETSPAFFKPDVLAKYKMDSHKYKLSDRSITCRNAWHLETYDVNEAGQVHTYLIYLSRLPYEEQLYWKSFNEEPKGSISKRAYRTDFLGSWEIDCDPLSSLRALARALHKARVRWWTMRSSDLPNKVHYPVTKSADEWAKEIHALDKLLNEGFEARELRRQVEGRGRIVDDRWRSLKLTEELLLCLDYDSEQAKELVTPLRELSELRSKMSGHAGGSEATALRKIILKEHKTFSAHFKSLCKKCDESMRRLQKIFSLRIYGSGDLDNEES